MLNQPNLIESAKRWYKLLLQRAKNFSYWKEVGLFVLAVILWSTGVYGLYFSSPAYFPIDSIVRIKKNSTISQVGHSLYEKKMIRSELLFKTLSRFSNSGKIVAGDYQFKKGTNVFTLSRRFTRGEFGIETKKITIHEGLNAKEIGVLLDKRLPAFDQDVFIEIASKEEGRLFPDTYFIKPSDDETDIVKMMTDNFEEQVGAIKLDLLASNKSLNEILTMASIIELETRTAESRRLVSGVLWNRIKQDMKLQVDAVFPFIMEKYSLQLSMKDLQFDSPYNTYRYKGLPPGPVCNPGLDSIKAAIEPTKTTYLFYLSDRSGKMHYAETYKAHMINRAKYLGS